MKKNAYVLLSRGAFCWRWLQNGCLHTLAMLMGQFCQLLPLPIGRNLLVLTGGLIRSTCVKSVILHAAETWAMTVATLSPLRRIDRSVILFDVLMDL